MDRSYLGLLARFPRPRLDRVARNQERAAGIDASVTRARLLAASLGGAVVSAALGVAITVLRYRSLAPLGVSRQTVSVQIAVGAVVGVLAGVAAASVLLYAPLLEEGRARIRAVIAEARPSMADLALMSVAAGVGEELLFRATLQPMLGIAGSTVLFVLAHFWVPLRGGARAVYVTFVVLASVILGVLFTRFGLAASMTAHAAIDAVILVVAFLALVAREASA
jgi:membrane protease YdiL (CAAX protease family)